MEFITITIPRADFDDLHKQGLLPTYEVKEVSFKDDFFKDDVNHAALKSASIKAYKALKDYEFKKRNP